MQIRHISSSTFLNIFTKVCERAFLSLTFVVIESSLFKAPDYALYNIVEDDDEREQNRDNNNSTHQRRTRGTQEHIDEIQDYWKGRYLSTGEAMWRILGFNITKKEPSVTAISVQLPTDRRVQRYIRNDNANVLSPLDHYFLRPLGTYLHDGITLRFQELKFEQYFSIFRLAKFDPQKNHLENYFLEQENRYGPPPMHVILRTGRFRHYARIREVSLSRGELFYLRAVLQTRPANSFSDARTVNGVEHQTFQDAAAAIGLFEDQTEADYILNEAIQALKTPTQLRFLFVQLLIDECILTPLQFWNTFQNNLCLDYTLRYPDLPQIAFDHGLDHIGGLLEEQGKQLSEYNLPQPTTYGREVEHELQKWTPLSRELGMRADAAYQTFNQEQRQFFDDVISAVTDNRPLLIFLDGKAGVGKTFLINAVCDKLRSLNIITLPTATSAYAAQLYHGGRTAHSTFKISFSYSCFYTAAHL